MKYVAYYRVSTQKQGVDGYGIQDQESARNKAIKKWSRRRVSFVKIYKSNPNLIGTITVGER